MVSVQLGSNPADELVNLLQLENTKLQYSLEINYHNDMHNMGLSQRPSVRLSLTYFVNQHPSTPLQIFQTIEKHLALFLKEVEGQFTQRTMEPYRGEYVTTIRYELMLNDYDFFIEKLPKLARDKSDREFTKALEAKLSET